MSLSDQVSKTWNVGKGRKSVLMGKDLLFISMSVLKLEQHWNFTARILKIEASTLERQVAEYLEISCSPLFEDYVI